MRVTDYKIVKDILEDRFEKSIKSLIQQGWQPHGNLIILPRQGDETNDGYFQAMVKIAED